LQRLQQRRIQEVSKDAIVFCGEAGERTGKAAVEERALWGVDAISCDVSFEVQHGQFCFAYVAPQWNYEDEFHPDGQGV
jgi:hypothetical protein